MADSPLDRLNARLDDVGGSNALDRLNALGGDTSGSILAAQDESLIWSIIKAPVRAAGSVLRGLDVVGRQAPWTAIHKGSAELGALLGTRSDPVPTWGQAWQETERGSELLKILYPDTFGVQDEYKDLDRMHTKILGGLMEIGGDVLNLITFFPKTVAGRAAAKTGELGLTWGAQGARAQRGVLGILGTTKVLESERIVKAVGALGRFMGDTRVGSALRKAFTTDLWHPGMRAAQRVRNKAGSSIRMQQLALDDALNDMRKGVPESMWGDITQASEHVHRPGWKVPGTHHNKLLQGYSPEVLKMAEIHQGLTNSALDLAQMHGLAKPVLGASIDRAIVRVGKEASTLGKEYVKLGKEMAGALPPADRKFVEQALDLRYKASLAQEEAFDLAVHADDLRMAGKGGTPAFQNAVQRSNNATRMAKRLDAQARMADLKADEAMNLAQQRRYTNPGKMQRIRAKMKKKTEDLTKLEQLADDRPAYIPHILDRKAQRFIQTNYGGAKQKSRLWSDHFQAMTERHLAVRYDPKTLEKVGSALDIEKSLLRPMSVRETTQVMRSKKFVADKMAKYQAMFEKESLCDRIKRIFKGGAQPPPQAEARRFFNLDPAEGLQRLNRNIAHAVESKAFIEEMMKQGDMVSRVVKDDSWFHIKDVSQMLYDTMGDAWVHPDLYDALRRMYTTSFSGGAQTAVGHAIDQYTKIFKRAVTTPESLPGIRRIPGVKKLPLWPAYHWRNNISDFTLMGYNGIYSPRVVAQQGLKAAYKKGGSIWCGEALGHLTPAKVNRMGRAYGVTFGEVRSMGAHGLGEIAENSRRLGYFVDRLQRGWAPYEASLEVKKVLFDYNDLTSFEQTYMRRVIPFYSWLRKNLGLQVKTLLQRPAIIQAQMRLGTTAKKDDVPAWVRGRMLFALDPDQQTGEERYLIGMGLPVENLSEILDFSGGPQEWWRQMAFQANPLLKLVGLLPEVAGMTGYDIERAREMRRPARADYLGWVERNFPKKWEWLQDVALASKQERYGRTYYTMDPVWDYAIRNSPLTRVHSTLKGAARSDQSLGAAALRYLTGYGVIRHDPEETARRERDAESRALLRVMERAGHVGSIDIHYGLTSEGKRAVRQHRNR